MIFFSLKAINDYFRRTFLSIIVKEQCVVLFPYTALNDDELSLAEGQIVSVITKDVEDKV